MRKIFLHPMGFKCHILKHTYKHGDAMALELVLAENSDDGFAGEPAGFITVNIPGTNLADNEILVKTWSENEGMMEALESAGIAHRSPQPGIRTGHVTAPRAIIDPKVLAEYLG